VRFDAAELSGEVGETLASDSQRTTVSHLGRAFTGAYRGDDECAGGLGGEVGALAWPAVSSGASPAMALRRSGYCCGARERRKKRREERGDRMSCRGAGWRSDQVKPVGRGASTTPAYGRHVAGAAWSEAGAAWSRERGGEAGRAIWPGRKGGGSAQQRLSPFLFFEFLFSKKFK